MGLIPKDENGRVPKHVRPGVESLLTSIGVPGMDTDKRVREAAEVFFTDRHIDANISSFQHRILSVSCSAASREFLRLDKDKLQDTLDEAAPGAVSSIRIYGRK